MVLCQVFARGFTAWNDRFQEDLAVWQREMGAAGHGMTPLWELLLQRETVVRPSFK